MESIKMNTEEYCKTLESLDRARAICAIQQAYLQLDSITRNIDCKNYDNKPALAALSACLIQAGHVGFTS
jgi:hypothetical protein